MKHFATLIAVILLSTNLFAQVSLPHVFSDHMVLQRDKNIPVWGNAKANTKITVVLADNKVSATSDANDNWMVYLPQLPAGGPYKLEIFEGKNKKPSIVFTDILIGDVWLASGQSNMELKVEEADNADTEIPNAYNDKIRLFNVPHKKSIIPLDNTLSAQWLVCDSTSVKTATAVGYYFAKKLVKENGVPIGILQSSWGGTPVEAWTSREMLLSNANLRERIFANDTLTEDDYMQDSLDLIKFWDIVYNPKNGTDRTIPKANFDDSGWRDVTIPGTVKDWEPDFYEGMGWIRKKITLPANFANTDLTINLGYPELNYTFYFNDSAICTNRWNAQKPHIFTIPSSIVKEGENTIAIRLAILWGGGGLNPPAKDIYITDGTDTLSICGTWKYKIGLEDSIPEIYYYQGSPTFLYNGMIHPILPYGLKGILWYQGENNQDDAYNYRYYLPLMINDWRIKFMQGNLPFLLVQLPNYYKQDSVPADGKWAVLRESQEQALLLPNTGMACIIDLGLEDNIHPTNKTDVGNRLADVAQKIVYGKDLVASGPAFESFTVEGNKIRISYTAGTAKGLTTVNGETVKGFAVAGADKKLYWANAVIEGNEIIVSSKDVPKPVAVRYAWANNPVCNVINSKGLPALPFRTDNWEINIEE